MTLATTPQLPLSLTLGGISTDDDFFTPPGFALPVGSVTATPEMTNVEETLLSGMAVVISTTQRYKAITLRVDVPSDHPVPILLGEAWARLVVGKVITASETYTDRRTRTQYINLQITANTLRVSQQASLYSAYYSGTIEGRLLVRGG